MAYTTGGCARHCPPQVKLDYRPALLKCQFTVAVGDQVVVQPGDVGCVTLVLGPYAIVQLKREAGMDAMKVKVQTLAMSQPAAPACKTNKVVVPPPANPLAAIISGPTQVSSKSCNVALDAYQSTSKDSRTLKYKWSVPDDSVRKAVTSGLLGPVLSFRHLPVGSHLLTLEVTNSAGATARSADFKIAVSREPAPVVSLACPPGVCTRASAGAYEIQVNLYEKTTLTLAVELASECENEPDGDLQPIVWQELLPKSGSARKQEAEEDWKPLQVRLLASFCIYLRKLTPHIPSPCPLCSNWNASAGWQPSEQESLVDHSTACLALLHADEATSSRRPIRCQRDAVHAHHAGPSKGQPRRGVGDRR